MKYMFAKNISSVCTLFICTWLFPACSFSCLPISENLAEIQEFTEIPTQSSSYDHNLFDATNAIDGKFEGEEGEVTACSFTIGGEQNTRAWWKLPLTQICHVEYMYLLIYFRSSSTYLFTLYVKIWPH